MPRRPLAPPRAVLAAVLLLAAAPAPAVDPFYAGLLRDGTLAYDRGTFPEAARILRLACFGLLEEPVPLAGCLVRLAVAQSRAGDADGFQETFRRVVEVEERFGAYAQAVLPAEVRTAFEERVAAAVPAATLATLPAFQRLVKKEPAADAAGSRKGRRQAAPNPPAAAPGTTAAAPAPAAPVDRPKTAGPTTAPPDPAPAPAATAAPPAPAQRPVTPAERQSLTEARRLLAGASDPAALRQALKLAREVADAHPADREAQHLAAEAAYRNSQWGEAVSYFGKGGDPGEARPELLFYLAVALFEEGKTQDAAAALRRALPNLERTPYVESYARRILGP
jgi:tetratricopeptide (TPR) repeat protein